MIHTLPCDLDWLSVLCTRLIYIVILVGERWCSLNNEYGDIWIDVYVNEIWSLRNNGEKEGHR